jgi:hypothetical protein
MVLCQINASQYILIRIPLNEKIFPSKTTMGMKSNLLDNLLSKVDKDDQQNQGLILKLKRVNTFKEDARV